MEIKNCTCKHEYQDQKYGKDKRQCNLTSKGKISPIYRCTVCSKEHS